MADKKGVAEAGAQLFSVHFGRGLDEHRDAFYHGALVGLEFTR